MRLSVLFSWANRTCALLLGRVSDIYPLIVGVLIVACFLPPPEMFAQRDGDEDSGPAVIALVPRRSFILPKEDEQIPYKLNNPTLPSRSISPLQALKVRGKDGRYLLRSFHLLRC